MDRPRSCSGDRGRPLRVVPRGNEARGRTRSIGSPANFALCRARGGMRGCCPSLAGAPLMSAVLSAEFDAICVHETSVV